MAAKNNQSKIIGAIVVVVIVLGAAYLLSGTSNQGVLGSTSTSGVPILLTDPPYVPSGTTALEVNYSSVAVFYTNGSQSGWVNAEGSGRLDLMSLVNVSELVANASIPNGAAITKARFNVSSATITINGTTYPVMTPSSQIIANVSSKNAVNSSTSVLVDLTPTIVTVFTNNQTLFIMVPSIRAVLVGNSTSGTVLHSRASLTGDQHKKLEDVRPNITITGATLNVVGNTTELSVSVMNNANTSVKLNHLLLYGNESAIVSNSPCPYTCSGGSPCQPCRAQIPSDISGNASVDIHGNGSAAAHDGGVNGIISGNVNINANGLGHSRRLPEDMSTSGNVSINSTTEIEAEVHSNETAALKLWNDVRVVNFFIGANGTLALPFDKCTYVNVGVLPGGEVGPNGLGNKTNVNISGNTSITKILPGAYINGNVEGVGGYHGTATPIPTGLPQKTTCVGNEFESPGMTLQAGQSATLQFNGNITLGYGFAHLKPIIGQLYNIRIVGEEGAHASFNTTAA